MGTKITCIVLTDVYNSWGRPWWYRGVGVWPEEVETIFRSRHPIPHRSVISLLTPERLKYKCMSQERLVN